VATDGPRFETKNFGAQAYLDVSATYDEPRRRLTVAVVNRRKEGDVLGTVELLAGRAKAGGRAYLITGPDPEAQNTFQNPRAVTTQEVKFAVSGNRWEHNFPPHSVSWLEVELEA